MDYNKILAVLNDMKNGNITRIEHGICINLDTGLFGMGGNPEDGKHFVAEASTSFFGRHIATPIEGDIISYLENREKWDKETEFGLRRHAYLDKLIAYAEDKLKEELL